MEKTIKNQSFTIEYTTFVKAVAVILMVVVHSIMDNADYSMNVLEHNICSLFMPVVSMFAILSGFGMMKSAKKTRKLVKLSLKRIVLVLVGYWMVFIVLFVRIIAFNSESLKKIYGDNFTLSLIKDIFGCSHVGPITRSIMPISWFIGTILIFYLLFPLIYKLVIKLGKFDFILLIITFIPIALLGLFKINFYTWDSIVYYMFSFILGMYIEKHDLFEFFVRKKYESFWKTFLVVAIVTIIFGFLRVYFGQLVDPICGFMYIAFLIFIVNKIKILDKVLLFIGGIEFFIYLIHYAAIKQCSAMLHHRGAWIYLVAFALTVIASVIYEFFYSRIKKGISSLKVFN